MEIIGFINKNDFYIVRRGIRVKFFKHSFERVRIEIHANKTLPDG